MRVTWTNFLTSVIGTILAWVMIYFFSGRESFPIRELFVALTGGIIVTITVYLLFNRKDHK